MLTKTQYLKNYQDNNFEEEIQSRKPALVKKDKLKFLLLLFLIMAAFFLGWIYEQINLISNDLSFSVLPCLMQMAERRGV